jgi:hypothetical protein
VFDQKKSQHTFGDSAGDRSGFTTDWSNITMVNIEELNKEVEACVVRGSVDGRFLV